MSTAETPTTPDQVARLPESLSEPLFPMPATMIVPELIALAIAHLSEAVRSFELIEMLTIWAPSLIAWLMSDACL